MLALLLSSSAYRVRPSFGSSTAPEPVPEMIQTVPLFRLYLMSFDNTGLNPGFHFYTTDSTERDGLLNHGHYRGEGIAGYVFNQLVPGTVPLYRLSKTDVFMPGKYGWNATKHFYTTNKAETDKAVNSFGFKLEGIQCYVAPKDKPVPGTVALYRLYHPLSKSETGYVGINRAGDDDHFYTTNSGEKYKAVYKIQYADEGIACYVWPQPATLGDGKIPKLGPGKPVGDADSVLLKWGCTRPGVGAYNCPTIAGYEACENYRSKGEIKACSTSANQKVQAAMEKELFFVGCSRFLNRPDEFRCKTQKSFDLCETYRKNGTLKKCLQWWK